MTSKVLVSACLMGVEVRYDGRGASVASDVLDTWRREGRLITVCPEVAGGLGVPRPPAEIVGGDGADVLESDAQVRTVDEDVSDAFVQGARAALALATEHDIRVAVLKERSPSCGSGQIYDGSGSRTLRDGDGVTTALLREHGIAVFGESQLAEADALLRRLDPD